MIIVGTVLLVLAVLLLILFVVGVLFVVLGSTPVEPLAWANISLDLQNVIGVAVLGALLLLVLELGLLCLRIGLRRARARRREMKRLR